MTIAAMGHEEESVYRLIPTVDAVAEKKPMYRSRHCAQVPPSYSTFGTTGTSKKVGNPSGSEPEFDHDGGHHKAKKSVASIGAGVGATVNPANFLKKSQKQTGALGEKFQRPEKEKKSAVPKQSEKPVMGLITEKNFVVSNAVDTILAPPKKQPLGEADMTQKKNYGKPPSYLNKIKAEVTKEQSLKRETHTASADPFGNKVRLLTEDEKRALLSGLKQKWEQLNKSYQSLTFSMDTVTKVGRKELQEAELEKLERAMAKLNNKKCIFVYDDTNTGFSSLGIAGRDPKDAAMM
eukprot:TRINITY_DN1181_c6_g1_i2.p1 TRINITY_DN1181_c6_g1~~TRINITY_DN1181_c6_g1_i2.p1  ORF type:complete len:313 (+),score=83.66 TRINITY_DN1181_c6_g1_i2:62-940(+)